MFFNKKKPEQPEPLYMTVDEEADYKKEVAIEYISSLSKSDKDNFIAGVEKIWEGRNMIIGVKTRLQRDIKREASKSGGVDDEFMDYLMTEGKNDKK